MIELTVFETADGSPLSKRFETREGKLCKASAPALAHGRARRVELSDISAFAQFVASLKPSQALGYGIAAQRDVEIATEASVRERPGAISRTRRNFAWPAGRAIFFIDCDAPEKGEPMSPDELRSALVNVCPALGDAPMCAIASASSYIYNGDKQLIGPRGTHLYVVVERGSDIERAGKALYERLWLAGSGRFEVSKAGEHLDRNLIDRAVWQPERLDYAAGASCAAPLEQRRPAVKVWNG